MTRWTRLVSLTREAAVFSGCLLLGTTVAPRSPPRTPRLAHPDRHSRPASDRATHHPAVLLGLYNEPRGVTCDVWLAGGEVEQEVAARAAGRVLRRSRLTCIKCSAVCSMIP